MYDWYDEGLEELKQIVLVIIDGVLLAGLING